MASKYIEFFTHSKDKHVFWLFWIFVVWAKALSLVRTHLDDTRLGSGPYEAALVLVVPYLVGLAVWKVLQMGALSSVRNLVIGVQGLVLIAYASFIAPAFVSIAFYFIVGEQAAHDFVWIAPVIFVLFIVPGFFLAGCWLGFKVDKPVLLGVLWSVAVAVVVWARWTRWGIPWQVFILIPPVIGTYVGRIHLSRQEEPC